MNSKLGWFVDVSMYRWLESVYNWPRNSAVRNWDYALRVLGAILIWISGVVFWLLVGTVYNVFVSLPSWLVEPRSKVDDYG